MSRFWVVCFLLTGFVSWVGGVQAQTSSDHMEKSQIMILGSYHMNNPGQDVHNLEADDVLAEKRQKEIRQFVELLATFKPTKIAIERKWQTESDTLAQERYASYLKGAYELNRGEDQQIGFRLAKLLGHKRIYCIDAPGKFDFNKMVSYANENGQGAFFEKANAWMQVFIKEEAEFLASHTVAEVLLRFNDPKMIKESHTIYVGMLQIGKGKDYPGAELVSDWYERNLRIFSNLTRMTNPTGDRVLVIFGAGHAPILRELVDYHPDYELVELGDYVK